ncbi:class I adenylate-forming enzyme family protein [Streptomyces sp. NPDC002896]|uniref:class I adenylate-forming enzyme family protein n=1 Tax=Streptomyces sp. NPDC002896 TaxID=3154438 RepID=UPI00332E09F1
MSQPANRSSDEPGENSLAEFLTGSPASAQDEILYWKDGSCTLAELTASARQLAEELRRCGVGPQEPVACVVSRGAEAVAAWFAVWLAGAVYIPVNGRLPDPEIHALLAESAPAAVIAGSADTDRIPRGLSRTLREPGGTWTVQRGEPWTGERFAPGDALVMHTSGTTGRPKPVVLSHAGVRDGIDTVLGKLRRGPRRTAPMPNLIPTSMALWAGMWNTLFAFRIGAPVILLDRFDTRDYALMVKRFGIRSTVLAPAMMTMLTEDPEITDLGPLTYVRSITAPLTPAQAHRFHERFGVSVLNSYGQTELGSEVVGWTAADLREHGVAKLGSVGHPHPGVSIRILDGDYHEQAENVVGEIYIRSPFAAQVRDRLVDGYLRTGDLGRVDADGFLWIEGRVSDVINRGGLKVIPQEVEEALRQLPGVADACVGGVPDDRLGEMPVAWVRRAPGTSADPGKLRAALRERIAAYKIPVDIRFVDSFPTSEIGKVLRHKLISSYAAS